MKKLPKISLPGWVFPAAMAVYCELLLHVFVTRQFHFGRLAVICLFAAGFGGVLGLLASLIPSRKWQKLAGLCLGAVLAVLYMTEYFLSDAYSTFMSISTIIGGAGGIARDYFALVMSLLAKNLWRIALVVLPLLGCALFTQVKPVTWRGRGILAAAAVLCYVLGFAGVHTLTPDAARLTTAYNFDSVVRTMGLNMGLTLDATGKQRQPAFVTAPTVPVPETQPRETVPGSTEPPGESVPATEPPIVYGDQVMEGVDFAALAEKPNHFMVKSMYEYLASQTPAKKNEYTGLFAGKNLILITAEAFTAEVIDPELTPTLYRLANQGVKFTDYYQPAWGASTTSGEYSNVLGLVPTDGGNSMFHVMEQKMFLTMGHQLQAQGYYSAAYHNHDASFYSRAGTHPHLGYDRFIARGTGMEDYITPVWPESDLEMIDFTLTQYLHQQPFSVYYMTVSGHCPYHRDDNAQTARHYDKVAHLDHSETVIGYLASQLELEAAMTSLVQQLEEAGIADDTVIVISTDHYPYGLEESSTWSNAKDYLCELYGVEEYDNFRRDRSALILWSGCLEGQNIVVDEPVYSLDILPTLSNLFGVEYDSRLLVGRDVFSGQEPLVLWPDHSWRTDKGTYDYYAATFTPNPGAVVEEGYVERISAMVANKISYSRGVVTHDFFDCLLRDSGRE